MIELSEKQQEIVDYIDGPLLVTAGPGSGKTRVLTEKIVNILNKRKGRVLALTFSNKAAEEINERIEDHVEDISRVKISTIHSFCLEILKDNSHTIGLPSNMSIIESSNDQKIILLEALTNIGVKLSDSKELANILGKISDYKSKFKTPQSLVNEEDTEFISIYDSYNKLMNQNRLLDFDDILFYSYKILSENNKVSKNISRLYKYFLVDEAQDLNDTQYKIIKKMLANGHNNIMFVGDEAQSIYGFNGSNSLIMTKFFVEDFSPKIFKLTENYRSAKRIIEAAQRLKPTSESTSKYPIEGVFEVKSFQDEKDEGDWIVEMIEDLINQDKESPSEIAVIGRNRYLFENVKTYLNDKDIDYNEGMSGLKLECETEEMRLFNLGIKIISNPYDEFHYAEINELLNRKGDPFYNRYDEEIINNPVNNNPNISSHFFSLIIYAWKEIFKDDKKYGRVLDNLYNSILTLEFEENLKYLIINDIEFLKKQWTKYCAETSIDNRSLNMFKNFIALGKSKETSLEGVSLITVHGSKGLEFNNVFIIGVTKGTFPDYRAKTEEQLTEEKNNMFVAITRAKRRCYITYPLKKMMPWGSSKKQLPSQFITLLTQ